VVDFVGIRIEPNKDGKLVIAGWLWELPDAHPDDVPDAHLYKEKNEHLESEAANPHESSTFSRCSPDGSMSNWKEPSNDAGFGTHVPDAQNHTIEDEHLEDGPTEHLENMDEEAGEL